MDVKKTESGFKQIKTNCPYHCNNGKLFIPGKGLTDCPHCTGLQGYEERVDETSPDNVFDVLKIPTLYRKCDGLSAEGYLTEVRKTYSGQGYNVEQYCAILEELYKAIDYGTLYKSSLLIRELPTSKLDINRFVYGIMIKALQRGLGVLPYIPVSQLTIMRYNRDFEGKKFSGTPLVKYSTNGVTGMSTNLMLRCKFAYDIDFFDYVLAPLVFIDVGTLATTEDLVVLQDLISERAKLNLPTYVTVNPRSGGMNLADLSDGLFDSMLTIDNYRLDRLMPVDYYALENKAYEGVNSLMNYIIKDNVGVVNNPIGVRTYTNDLIKEKENDNG